MSPNLLSELLDLWEHAVTLSNSQRDDALLRAINEPVRGLGARNAALVKLRANLFGTAWPLRGSCPRCKENSEFSVDAQSLATELASTIPDAEQTYHLTVSERSIGFRLPSSDDLIQAASGDPDTTALALLQRCVVNGDQVDLDVATQEQLSTRMQELDPAAVVSFSITCPACSHAWDAVIDVGSAVWTEVKAAAERLLLDVDVLARTYGWTEPQILALSPLRRAAYLQLAGAA